MRLGLGLGSIIIQKLRCYKKYQWTVSGSEHVHNIGCVHPNNVYRYSIMMQKN